MFRKISQAISLIFDFFNGTASSATNQDHNPFAPPCSYVEGKMLAGFDLSTSMKKHGAVACWAWNESLLSRFKTEWPNLKMRLVGVHSRIIELNERNCYGSDFVSLGWVRLFALSDFKSTKESGLLKGGSAFEDYFVFAEQVTKSIVNKKSYEPIIVTLVCDGCSRSSKATRAEAKEAIRKMRKRGVVILVSCFVPNTDESREQMEKFRDELGLNKDTEFSLIFQEQESQDDESSAAAINMLADSILLVGRNAEEQSKLGSK